MEDVSDINNKMAKNKVVIFSQWTSMLDLIEVAIQRKQRQILQSNSSAHNLSTSSSHTYLYNHRRLDGTMSRVDRAKAVSDFGTPDVDILLISLR